ncbi:hypothetical protein FXO37_27418 [Capsicum annuum]|nr:hypothetical protein FXO37_27418 [Capsicum annuum]
MCPTMNILAVEKTKEKEYQKGVRHLCESGITRIPKKYVLPISDRPLIVKKQEKNDENLNLPIIDFAQLQGPNRSQVLKSLAKACEEYGFFQLVNHGIDSDTIQDIIEVGKKFFELPFEERAKYMSTDMQAPVRLGTSFNQNKDGVFCWRDFLKLSCHSLSSDLISLWPSSPIDLREAAANYSKQTNFLYQLLIGAILESLGIVKEHINDSQNLKEFEDGSQLLVLNCYPCCPEPDLTLGMPPHSDYGLLTLLLQDEVKGLQIQHQGKWLTVEPIPNSFVVNVGDHLEIFSNGSRIPLVRTSSELVVRRAGKALKGTVPSPSPGRHAATRSRRGSNSSSPLTADEFRTGTPVPSPQSQSFSRSYGSILLTFLACIVPSTRGCSPWRPDAVLSTTGRGRHSVLRIFKGRRERTEHHAMCGALPAAGPYFRLSRFQGGQAVKQKR